MITFHKPLSPTERKTIPELENSSSSSSSKKRKWEEPEVDDQVLHQKPNLKAKSTRSTFDADEKHLHTHQLPLQLQHYNPTIPNTPPKDPRTNPDPTSPGLMSLDLELNLPCGSTKTTTAAKYLHAAAGDHFPKQDSGVSCNNSGYIDPFLNCTGFLNTSVVGGLPRCPSWLAFGGDQREMVTAVCKKCHMLVMMYKSSPSCPNCKFMHPPHQSPSPNLFNFY